LQSEDFRPQQQRRSVSEENEQFNQQGSKIKKRKHFSTFSEPNEEFLSRKLTKYDIFG
jgi:hypothetical protein